MPEPVDPIYFILSTLQADMVRLENKQDSSLVTSTKLVEQLDAMSGKVVDLNKLLTLDNGRPSIVSQLNNLSNQIRTTSTEVTDTKGLVSKLTVEVSELQKQLGMKTPKEVAVERWKTLGMVAAGLIATIPGILSFIHSFFSGP